MTIKEQFAEVVQMAHKPEKDMNKKVFIAKCMLLMASLEDPEQPVDATAFECLDGDKARDVLQMVVGLFGAAVAE